MPKQKKRDGYVLPCRLHSEDLSNLSTVRHGLDVLVNPGGVSSANDAVRFALATAANLLRERLDAVVCEPTGGGNGQG